MELEFKGSQNQATPPADQVPRIQHVMAKVEENCRIICIHMSIRLRSWPRWYGEYFVDYATMTSSGAEISAATPPEAPLRFHPTQKLSSGAIFSITQNFFR
jgi:hypothetical protein